MLGWDHRFRNVPAREVQDRDLRCSAVGSLGIQKHDGLSMITRINRLERITRLEAWRLHTKLDSYPLTKRALTT